jgi:hypothetical protein
MQRSDLPQLRRPATYVLPRWRLVYVSTPKAACTSIKWLLADLQGVDPAVFHRTLDFETTRAATIHRERRAWGAGTPTLAELPDDELAEITPDAGWFVFTATRDPATRLWSAWQSKLLLREPAYADLSVEPWYPRIPTTVDEVMVQWRQFLDHVGQGMPSRLAEDPHFRPQSALLGLPVTPYDRVYDTTELGELVDDLRGHLGALGWDGELRLRRTNETPLPAPAAAFDADALDAIHAYYAEDYRLLSYSPGVPPRAVDPTAYPAELVAAVGLLVERHERIADLTRLARKYRAAAEHAASAQPVGGEHAEQVGEDDHSAHAGDDPAQDPHPGEAAVNHVDDGRREGDGGQLDGKEQPVEGEVHDG